MTLAAALKIENFQDILDVLDREPELLRATRNYFLSQELQAIPATVAELTAVVKELVTNAQASNARLDRLEAIVARLQAAVARLEAIVAQLATDQAELKAIVAQLAETVRANTDRLDRLEAAVSQLTEVVQLLAADHAGLKAIVQANTEVLSRIGGRVDSISGDRYQRFVARVGHRAMRRELAISDLTITHTDWAQGDIIRDIAAADALADYEAYDATSVDFIAAGHNESGDPVFAAGEISITLQPDDIYKTARRAGVIGKALAAATFPVAIGQHIPEDTAAAAVEHGVTVIAIEPPE